MTARILALALVLGIALPGRVAADDEGAAGPAAASERAEHRGLRHLLDTLEVLDTPVYSRNLFELKYEWTQQAAGASMTQLMLKPLFAWGENREFAVRVELPVQTEFASDGTAASGFASVTTTVFWAFFEQEGLRQSIGLELQWNTATNPAVGAPWIIEPIYGIGYRFNRWLALTVELNWQKSFGNLGGYLPVNTLQLKPTLSAALPAWFFVSVQDKTSWSIQDQNVGSLLKITAGRFLTAGKTVVLAAEYETPLDPVAAKGVVMMVGVFLGYFYSW